MAIPTPRLARVPVWVWRALMAHLAPGELRRFNLDPIDSVDYRFDIDYVGDGLHTQRLDVISPRPTGDDHGPLPVYVYFHGGGWTSGDKAPLTRYCASQAASGMVVVNVNYRMAPRFRMADMLRDADASVAWVVEHIAELGGDPDHIVLGGDSAGGQIAALLAATTRSPELAAHYGVTPVSPVRVRGVIQHCSINDFSVIFEKGFVLGLGFVRMLLPARGRGLHLASAARYLSPIEWVGPDYPPVLVTTSRRDPMYRSNLNFVAALQRHGVEVDCLVDNDAAHTWQQDSRHPASAEVYRRLQGFVRSVMPALAGRGGASPIM